jgi:hypothetical protein
MNVENRADGGNIYPPCPVLFLGRLLRFLMGKKRAMKKAAISLHYSAGKFVDREAEIEKVLSKARALAERRPVDRRTVIFIGERGTGKSWLLAHLQNELGALPGVVVFLVSLGEYAGWDPIPSVVQATVRLAAVSLGEYAGWDPILAVADLLKRLSAATGGRREGLGATLADMSRNLMQDVRQWLGEQAFVLLVDQVYESDWRLLAALEDYLLGPLAVEPRALIVMAGRGRAYPWKTPELRLKAEFIDLWPFPDESTTAEQLKRQHKKAVPRAPDIHALSGGNPLANYLLAVHDDPAAALDQVIEGMLETVPAAQRRQVRDYLEALCVLNSFDEERIPTMLAAYYDDESYRRWSYAQARQVREELVKWAFARWDADRGGYVLDGPTRRLLERYLETARRDQWERLQNAASALYTGWAQDYPRTKERWQREVEYHIHRLQNPPLKRSFAAARA